MQYVSRVWSPGRTVRGILVLLAFMFLAGCATPPPGGSNTATAAPPTTVPLATPLGTAIVSTSLPPAPPSATSTAPTLGGAPTPAPNVTPTVPPVTLQDNNRTLTLHTGQEFLLQLGEGYNWDVTVDNPAVLKRLVNVLVIRGAQGVYQAEGKGRATLTANGDPTCRQSQPPCAMPSRSFTLHVVVQ